MLEYLINRPDEVNVAHRVRTPRWQLAVAFNGRLQSINTAYD